jgi:hypothetical protein
MNYHNLELHEKVKSYVKAAIQYITEAADLPSSQSEPITSRLIFLRKEFETLPEYQECLLTFKNHPAVFDQFNRLTGIGMAGSCSWPVETFMLHLPQLLGIHNEICEFNEAFFEEGYSKLEETFYSDEISFEVIAPLQGPKFNELIKLEDNLEICLVNVKDLTPIIDNDSIKRKDKVNLLDLETCWAIRTSYRLPKILGHNEDDREKRYEQDKENEEKREYTNEIVEQVVIALRLYSYYTDRFSDIYPATILHRARSLLFPQKKTFRIRYFPDFSFTWNYNSEFTKTFQKFWYSFRAKSVIERKFIGVAARRFSFAHERYNSQDKIVDLLIAAEALFLCDQGGIGELRYRLSLRAAFFLTDDSQTRKRIFADFKTAYDLRSKIVHGSEVEKDFFKIKDSEEYGIDGFVKKIQLYICCAIYKAIAIANEPNSPKHLVNWDELVF